MERNLSFSDATLAILRALPEGELIAATDIPYSGNHPARLKQLRRLVAHGVLEPAKHRPLIVQLSTGSFPRNLTQAAKSNANLAPVIQESGLPVLAALVGLGPTTQAAIAQATGLHPNTVATVMNRLAQRALVTKTGDGYSLSPHAIQLRSLAQSYLDHQLRRKLPAVPGMLIRNGLHAILQTPHEGLPFPITAVARFQQAGADVLASQVQYRISALASPTEIPLRDAYLDAVALGTAPRTLQVMQEFLDA